MIPEPLSSPFSAHQRPPDQRASAPYNLAKVRNAQ
eukprot:CAMPEP_0174695420 /NCGR_PEP_ID=MMETSP1094-20130205/1793_1 /TAXON_ID=156173 /ORGANISM="Chrysochromulina brevifilum, Strain UTEX LB 985" /LENGTH=34 /DNA_ID= /DNA_START= /DNA_END= /DNA_ORIENTATION=